MCPGHLINFNLGSPQAEQRDHSAASLEPPLHELVLGGVGDARHLPHLRRRVPPPLHAVQRAEAQPDHPALLVEREHASSKYDRVGLPLGPFRWRPRRCRLQPKPLLQEGDLAVQLQSSTRHLRLRQRLILLLLLHLHVFNHMRGLVLASLALACVLHKL